MTGGHWPQYHGFPCFWCRSGPFHTRTMTADKWYHRDCESMEWHPNGIERETDHYSKALLQDFYHILQICWSSSKWGWLRGYHQYFVIYKLTTSWDKSVITWLLVLYGWYCTSLMLQSICIFNEQIDLCKWNWKEKNMTFRNPLLKHF